MSLIAWFNLSLLLAGALYILWLYFQYEHKRSHTPRHRGQRRPSGDRLMDSAATDEEVLEYTQILREQQDIVLDPPWRPAERGDTLCEAPGGGYIGSDECPVCAGDVTDIDDLPPDLAAEALQAMRECEADAAARLRRAMETSDD